MPPTRRKSTQASSRTQKPLSFGPSANKVTKPSAHTTAAAKSLSTPKRSSPRKAAPAVKEISPEDVAKLEEVEDDEGEGQAKNDDDALNEISGEGDEAGTSTAKRDLAIRNQLPSSAPVSGPTEIAPKSANTITLQSRDPLEEKARRVPDSAIKKYWQGIEDLRKAPRVHQSTLPLPQKILRHFDLSSQYGPCIGIPRLRRWKRAEKLGLKPPVEVLSVLLKEMDVEQKGGEGGGGGVQRAYVDELMSNRWEMEP